MTASSSASDAVTVRTAGIGDAEALLQLHREGFGSDWTMKEWRWRFVDNPLGSLNVVGAFTPSGSCLCSFGGVPLPCLYGGEAGLVLRSGDAAVHPSLRSTMASGLLVKRTGAAFFDQFGDRTTRIAFGFPGPGLTRSLIRHCRFEVMADILLLVRDIGKVRGTDSDLQVDVVSTLPEDVDELSRRFHEQVATGIVRDDRYLRWRYESNPHARYAFATTRSSSGALRGLAVLRTDGLDQQSVAVLEWVVPNDDAAAESCLLAAVDEVARVHDRPSVVCSLATSSPPFTRFQRVHGFRVMRSPFRFAFRSYAAGINQPFLAENWHHSLGDMDFT